MKPENSYQSKKGIKLDSSYLLRCIKRNSFIIAVSICLSGAIFYCVFDFFLHDSYCASVDLAIIARDNSSGKLSQYNMESVVIRSQNILNSDTLKEQITRLGNSKKYIGNVVATRVTNSNIITLTAKSSTMESAFGLLKIALEEYPSLSNYFDVDYVLVEIDNLSAESIIVVKSNIAMYVFFIMIVVFVIGIGITICMSMYTDKIHSKEQAENDLDMEMLGYLSHIRKRKNQKAVLINNSNIDFSYMEEMNKAVTRIQDRMDEKKQKILMITSIRENDGKSTIAANIALSLAKRRKKVMLVDCDFRHSSLAQIFDKEVDDKKQFSSYLLGKADLQEVIRTDEKIKGIDFILQKMEANKVDHLLNIEKIKEALQEASLQEEYIILDTPPIGVVRDAEILSKVADTVLVVIAQDQEKVQEVNDIIDVIEDTGVNVIGGILNRIHGKSDLGSRNIRYGKYYYEINQI